MESLGDRLTEHLAGEHVVVPSSARGIGQVMARGRAIRRRRVAVTATAGTVAVAGLIAASLSVLHRPEADDAVSQQPRMVNAPATPAPIGAPGEPTTDDQLLAAERADTGIVWSAEESTAGLVFGGSYWNSAASGGAAVYALGTAPTPKNTPVKQQLFRTDDGMSFAASGPAFDPWISSLDDDGSRVYALGTAPIPGGEGFAYQLSTSDDGGESWRDSALPVDFDTIRTEVGSAGSMGTQVVVGDGEVVAMVNLVAFGDPSAVLPGDVDARFGSVVTESGVDVYGPPEDLDAIAETECPPGWPLVEGEPRPQPNAPNTVAAQGFAAVAAVVPGVWHCESPSGDGDIWVEPTRVHGPVVRSIPFDQLTISDDSIRALRGEPRLFRSTDGELWSEVTLPRSVDLRNGSGAQLMWAENRYVFTALTTQGSVLFTSPDGESWMEGAAPETLPYPVYSALPDGSLTAVGQVGGVSVVAHSTDDSSWSVASLDGLLQLDATWRSSVVRALAGPTGLAIVVQAQRDPVAASGGMEIVHDRFTLRFTDQNSNVALVDGSGKVLETGQLWGWQPDDEGWLRSTNNGTINIVDPDSGDRVDLFTSAEMDRMWNRFWESDEGVKAQSNQQPSASWVIDTVDGRGWAVTSLNSLGFSASNSYPATAVATTKSLQFGFLIPTANGTAAIAAALVGVRR